MLAILSRNISMRFCKKWSIWNTLIQTNKQTGTNSDLRLLRVIDSDLQWLSLSGGNWRWFKVTDGDWQWLTLSDSDWQWLRMAYSDWGTPSEIKTVLCGKNSQVGWPPPSPSKSDVGIGEPPPSTTPVFAISPKIKRYLRVQVDQISLSHFCKTCF